MSGLYADRLTFPALQDIVSWHAVGFIKTMRMQKAHECDGVETYYVVITAQKHNGNSMARKESLG